MSPLLPPGGPFDLSPAGFVLIMVIVAIMVALIIFAFTQGDNGERK